MRVTKLSFVCLLTLVLLGLIGNFAYAIEQDWNVTPQRQWSSSYNATLQDEIVDWTDLQSPTGTWEGATVYDGDLWVMDGGKIYYSTDGGSTFTEHCTMPDSACFAIQFLNASDKLVAFKGSELWYSTNNGSSWTSGLTVPTGGSFARWNFAMDELGHIYMGLYGDYTSERHIIYKSIDYGATWTEAWNHTGRHIHKVAFDDYEDRLWAGCGDPYDYGSTPYDTYFMYSDDNGANWSNYTTLHKPTAIVATENYLIYENDYEGQVYRINKTTDELEFLFKSEFLFDGGYAESMMYDATNDVVYMQGWQQTPTNVYSVWISPDEGLHWQMIQNTTSFTGPLTEIDSNGYLYLVKGFRLKALSHEEAEQLTFHIWKEGDRPSGESVEFEVTLINGQDYVIPLYQEPLTDVEVKFEGVSFENILLNPSFENDFTSWTQTHGSGSSSAISTTTVYNGSKSAQVKRGTTYSYIEQTVSATAGHDYLLKGVTATPLNFSYASTSTIVAEFLNVTNDWLGQMVMQQRNPTNLTFIENVDSDPAPTYTTKIRVRCQVTTNNMEAYFDAISIIDITNLSEEWEYYARALPPIDAGLQNTTNPSISINGETVSYTGQIANASETSATNLTGTLYEDIAITSVSISGSNIVKLVVTGDRIFDASDMLLLRDQSDLYYATSTYSSPTLTSYDTSMLMVYSSVNATLSALSYTNEQLSFTVTDTGTSTTSVYCGTNGEPTAVTGATSSSYDPSTTIETITVTHSSSQEIVLDWSEAELTDYEETRNVIIDRGLLAISLVSVSFVLMVAFGIIMFTSGQGGGEEFVTVILTFGVFLVVAFLVAVIIGNFTGI